jgi:hypothetical protein
LPHIKIAIACPKGVKTGGPEALHQLCHELNKYGAEAFLINTELPKSAVFEYEKYNAPWETVEKLTTATHLVVPETVLEIPKWWKESFSGEVIVWWLSVDNSSFPGARNYEFRKHPLPQKWRLTESTSLIQAVKTSLAIVLTHILNVFGNLLPTKSSRGNEEIQPPMIKLKLADCNHIAQSVYAQTWVSRRFRKQTHLVSDYIWRGGGNPKTHSAPTASASSINTKNLTVAFNARRGPELVELVKEFAAEGVKFVALKDMSEERVSETLSGADVYLDLGNFPGRDRTPREATLFNCPVLIARRGSARHHGDFPIDDFYRVDLELNSPESLARRVYEIAMEKSVHTMRQTSFRDTVSKAEEIFSQEVKVWLDYLKLSHKGVN